MKCPHCHEEVEKNSIICSVCGEKIPTIYSIFDSIKTQLPKIRKIFTICMLSILFVICIFFLVNFMIKTIDSNKLTDTGYKSIELSYTPVGSFYDVLSSLGQQEQDLITFFKKSKKEQDNSKLFAIFMDNVNKTRQYFTDNFNYEKSLSEQGIITATKITDANPNPIRITSPTINILKVCFRGAVGLMIDYDYVLKTYTPYLTDDWKEYFELSKQLDNDLQVANYNDDGISFVRTYSKWANKWKEFTKKYPDFHMNGDIYEMIQEYEGFVNNYY